MSKVLSAIVCAVIFACAGLANATTIMHTDSIGMQTTNWSDTLTIPLFDDLGGTLTLLSVKIELTGSVEGDAAYESLDASPSVVTLNLGSDVEVQRPDFSTLVVTMPQAQEIENATAHDGNINFDGDSGSSFVGLNASDAEMNTLTDAADLLLFTGIGNIVLPAMATGTSSASGPGNVIQQFLTGAGADIKVTYQFRSNLVPTPAAMPAGLAMLGLLGAYAKMRRSA